VEMLVPAIPYTYSVVLNTVLSGACLIGLIGVSMATEEIERIDEKVADKRLYISSLQLEVQKLEAQASDPSAKKALKELTDTIRYSDPMSSPQLMTIENAIAIRISVLTQKIWDPGATISLCEELQALFTERNAKCKTLK